MTPDLRLGRWQDALADVVSCDLLLCDPPYSARTHEGQSDVRDDLDYSHFAPADVRELVAAWAPRVTAWMACMTDDVLAPVYREAYEAVGMLDFAAVPIVSPRVRLSGDGPASSTVWLMVARHRTRQLATWGALPGWYEAPREVVSGMIGCKPVGLMRALIRDYSRPGDLIVDPFAGSGTTLDAARREGRRSIGAECDPAHYEIARKRLSAGFTPQLFA